MPEDGDRGCGAVQARGFELLWRESQGVVAGYLFTRLGDHQQVDDLLQDVAVAALQAFATYDPQRHFGPWVMGIAKHKLKDHLRRRSGRERVMDPAQAAQVEAFIDEDFDHWQQRTHAMRGCLEKLPDAQRALLDAYYVDGRNTTQLAADRDQSVTSLKVRLHRIRSAVRRCVDRVLAAKGEP